MPWCPVCKNEYREGYTTCAECKVPLVSDLGEAPVAIYFGSENEIKAMVEFLKDNDFHETSMSYDEKENVYELFVKSDNEKAAKRMLKDFIDDAESKRLDFSDLGLCDDGSEYEDEEEKDEEEMEEADYESLSTDEMILEYSSDKKVDLKREQQECFKMGADKKQSGSTVYQNKHEKAEEYKSSASALMIVGILGIVLIVINELDVLPFSLDFNKPMVYGVMGTVFVLFIIFAIYSMAQYKKILKQADVEDDIVRQIKEFLDVHFSKEQVLSGESGDGKSEEQLYFQRTARMKTELTKQFTDIEDVLIEKMVDDHYDELFS